MNFDYAQPVKIHFGNGRLQELPQLLADFTGKGLLICSKRLVKNGFTAKLFEENKQLAATFTEISENPDVTEAQECVELIREKQITFIVALGGGSVIDLAKVCGTLCFAEEEVAAYLGSGLALPEQRLPLIAIPTTSGTGTEVTAAAVLTDRELGKKSPIISDNFYPDIALVDPELTLTVPPRVTANTGMDALCQAIEGYWSKGHQPICDALAIHAARLIFENLLTVYHEPENLTARENMSEAALIAGLAFAIPKTTSSHACSYPLTNIYGIPHGEACTLTIDYFAKVNASDRLLAFANRVGFSSIDEMCEKIHAMKVEMNMRTDLKDFDISPGQLADLVSLSHHPNLLNNPVEITDEILEEMYQSLI
ncbi:iron-containing alcohol dehydrogenase family protein [Enterococcus olivae]